jgi:hypothetical protein
MRWLMLGWLMLLLGAVPTQARSIPVAWPYPDGIQQTGFALEVCLLVPAGCAWRETQHLGPNQRGTQVQVPGDKIKCVRVVALRRNERSDPSEQLCFQ